MTRGKAPIITKEILENEIEMLIDEFSNNTKIY